MVEVEMMNDLLAMFDEASHDLDIFMSGIVQYIGRHPQLNKPSSPAVHSFKSRLKSREHLAGKIQRKTDEGRTITKENLFQEITDMAGVRILHLFQEDFQHIDEVIRKRVTDEYWFLGEKPKVYTWDPEAGHFFSRFDLEISEKSTSYTSVHYLIRPKQDSLICCELQVRTLFEEIWGEVDHQINYPHPTNNLACREQLKVLSKITGAGSRLLDSLRRVHSSDGVR